MGSFMAFDWILFGITGFLSVWFFTGHGERIIKSFDSNQNMVRRKLSPEQKAKFLRACGVFCLILCLTSLMLAFFHSYPIIPWVSIGVALADIIFFAVYTNRNFPTGTKF